MKILRNLKDHVSGLVECEILIGEEWHPHAIESAEEYELHESSDWTDVKPCDQSEKDAHEEALRKQLVLDKISELESTITPRRLREAVMGDTSFTKEVEAQVSELRKEL